MNQQKGKVSWIQPFRFSFFSLYLLLQNLLFTATFLTLASFPASAQFGAGIGLTIQLVGMVQVEPGATVITLDVKDTEIRFQAQDVVSMDRDFSVPQFLAELRRRSPNLTIDGPEYLLDLLLEEKPNKRAIKLSGIYYHESRRFVLSKISTVNDSNRPQF